MIQTALQQAIFNNAHWCEAICAAHGIPGQFRSDLWWNCQRVPRFYPNLITLTAGDGIAPQLAAIQDLIAAANPGTISVKDSFNILDLAPFGLRRLFEANWLWRTPNVPLPPIVLGGAHYRRVQEADELARWEHMWNGGQPASEATRLFVPALLANPNIAIIAVYNQQDLVGGAIANRTGAVVGVSNIVVPSAHAVDWWNLCLHAIIELFPDLALVGYEHGEELIIAQQLGFESIGPLCVWG